MQKDKMLNDINNILNSIVTPDQAKSINLTYKPNFNGYEKGEIMMVGEAKQLKKGDLIHCKYVDEDGKLRFNDIDEIDSNENGEICTKGMYTFPIEDYWEDSRFLKDMDNSGWTFTISKVCKF